MPLIIYEFNVIKHLSTKFIKKRLMNLTTTINLIKIELKSIAVLILRIAKKNL